MQIYIMGADGANLREIARGLDDFNAFKYPSLTPDGMVVVFDRNNEINAINVDGTNQRYVVRNWTTTEETPAVSPDGHNVAYAVVCSTGQMQIAKQIAVVALAGPAPEPCNVTFATPSKIGHARRPAWGPDDYLAFELSAEQFGGGATTIAITQGPGHEPCEVVSGPARNLNPHWAPEGWEPPPWDLH